MTLKSAAFSRVSLFWPLLVAAVFASYFVISTPGPIVKDAAEYDALAQSILHGEFSLNGEPTMLREPIYPLFRAILYGAGFSASGILWAQAAFLVAAVWITVAAVRRIDPRLALLTAWISAFAYGMLAYASSHTTEALTTFFLALTGYTGIRAFDALGGRRNGFDAAPGAVVWRRNRVFGWCLLLGTACGVLALTRATYEFLGIALAASLLFARRIAWRQRFALAAVVAVASTAVMFPWMLRNERQFGQRALSQRAGVTLYARAVKAKASWETIAESYGSAFFGQSTVRRRLPNARPIVRMEHWGEVWQRYGDLQANGLTVLQADVEMARIAVQAITSDVGAFVRFIAWTPIDLWRLLALPSPLSPFFNIEAMFIVQASAGPLNIIQIGVLVVAHLAEWLWIGLTLAGLAIAFRHYGPTFVPGLLLAYTILIHAPVDAIERYAVPVTPWRIACIVTALVFFLTLVAARRARTHSTVGTKFTLGRA